MPEKNWSQIVAELRGLYNEIVAMEDDPDADFLDTVEWVKWVAEELELRYRCSGE